MASASVRMGRARALLKEAERSRMRERERERAEREAHARRFIAENQATHDRIAAPSPEERKLRRSLTARMREAETARLNAEIPLSLEARRVIANLRYHAETVRQRDENVFWPESDAWCRGRELPPLNDNGHVPGMDPTGRVLALIGNRLVYVRRTRLFASLALGDAYGLAAASEKYPAEAERLTVVREARALFWDCMRRLRALDAEWGVHDHPVGTL